MERQETWRSEGVCGGTKVSDGQEGVVDSWSHSDLLISL